MRLSALSNWMAKRAQRDERGSIAIFMIVVMVATGLVMITAATVESGLKTSRRGGDSANALQVADAGVNDAVRAIQTVAGTSFTRTGTVGTGSYTYTATQDANDPLVWLIDVYGQDKSGVKRHVTAQASGQPLFASPMYVNTSLNADVGGILDSFKSGVSMIGPSGNYSDGGCTGNGIMFFSPSANVNFGSNNNQNGGGGQGASVTNCGRTRYGTSWTFGYDGCYQYGGVFTIPSGAMGPGKCPDPNDPNFPGRTKSIVQEFSPPDVFGPTYAKDVQSPTQTACADCEPDPGTSFTCDTPVLRPKWTYYYKTITLKDGCAMNPLYIPSNADPKWVSENTVKLFATTLVLDTGTHGTVNKPPVAAAPLSLCGGSTTAWAYSDQNHNPAYYYCTGWVRSLEINLLTTTPSTITIKGNGGNFWGTFTAPTASVTLNSPNMEFWGAMLAGNLTVKTQFSWHYDDSLSQATTGKYNIKNWREVGT